MSHMDVSPQNFFFIKPLFPADILAAIQPYIENGNKNSFHVHWRLELVRLRHITSLNSSENGCCLSNNAVTDSVWFVLSAIDFPLVNGSNFFFLHSKELTRSHK